MNVRLIRWPDREPIFFHAYRVQFCLSDTKAMLEAGETRNGSVDDWVTLTVDHETADRLVSFLLEIDGVRAGVSGFINSEDCQFPGDVCVVVVRKGVGMLSVMDDAVNGKPTEWQRTPVGPETA